MDYNLDSERAASAAQRALAQIFCVAFARILSTPKRQLTQTERLRGIHIQRKRVTFSAALFLLVFGLLANSGDSKEETLVCSDKTNHLCPMLCTKVPHVTKST
jgi:hypothetical protein